MAVTPFIHAPFGSPGTMSGAQTSSELSFTRNFDINRPAVMVFFAHGHYATVGRDVVGRQNVLQQLERAGLNAVLVAPQLAYNAADSGAGRFAEPGFAQRYFDEAAQRLAQMHATRNGQTRPSAETLDAFRRMPISLVSYSGGYGASLAIMEEAMRRHNGPTPPGQQPLGPRIQSAVLLDTLYGGGDTVRRFAEQPHRPYVVSNYIPDGGRNLTSLTNQNLAAQFAENRQLAGSQLTPQRNVRILQDPTGDHTDLVQNSLASLMRQIPGMRSDVLPTNVAQAAPQPSPQPSGINMWKLRPPSASA